MVKSRRFPGLILACYLVCLPTKGLDRLHAADAKSSVDKSVMHAVATSPTHPALIRNEHAALLRVVVDVAEATDVQVQALTFDLRGSDDLADIESVAIFFSGDRESFSPDMPFGKASQPSPIVTFDGEQSLKTGKNVFWLSCRLREQAGLSRHVAAACTKVETSRGSIIPTHASPHHRHRIGVALRRKREDGVHTYRIPALCTSPKGTLLCVYDMRRRKGSDLQEDIDVGLSRSTDGGKTWESPRVILDMGPFGGLPQEQNGCGDPGIVIDQQTGEIFCFALWVHGKPGKHQWVEDGSEPGFEIGKTAQFMMVRSKDDGVTWTEPENLTRKLKQESWWLLAPSPQAGINLPDGTLVMPVEGRTGQDKLATFATVMISRDHGATWTVGEPAYVGGNECQAARLGDGSIMLNIRNDRERFRAVAVTTDLGRSWNPHSTSRNTLIEPNCNGSLLRVDYQHKGQPHHALLFANPHTQNGRTHHTIQVSFDDGATWPTSHHLLLDEGSGAGYPSLTRIDPEHVGIVYEGSQAHLVFERIPLQELLHPIDPAAIRIQSADHLPNDPIACERIPLGDPGDYKACIARLPDGELLLTAFHPHEMDDGRVLEQVLLFRSWDDGRTWTAAEKLDLLGREPYLTVTNDGTIFMTGHLLGRDVRNRWGYTTGFLHRSTDRGKTWESVRVESEVIRPNAINHTSRNVLQMSDGSLLLGVDHQGEQGPCFVWKSVDGGKSWDRSRKCEPRDWNRDHPFFGGETWLWQARSGKVWALVRATSNIVPIENRPIQALNDQSDHFILFSSLDGGLTFDRIRDFGDYGEMYMSLLRLQDQRLLLTFTVRDLQPPLGVRAILGTETDDGFEFDFNHDRLLLDTRTPIGTYQGGGFGPSVQLADGTLVTSYSYRGGDNQTRLEVVRWQPPATQ